jgi:hypothetical protein
MLDQFREVWLADFEFGFAGTLRPEVVCLVAHELHSGHTIRLWRDEMGPVPPYDTGPDSLFIAFFACAELDCHRALGRPMPARILDLFCEFRDRFNGLPTLAGNGLLGALAQFGLDGIGAEEKKDMRDLALRGGPWTQEEREALLDYCESDVVAMKRLLPAMLPAISIPHGLMRGRYMAAVSAMQHNGVPVDTETLVRLRGGWEDIQDALIAAVDADYGVYDGRTFKTERFAHWLAVNNIPWPRLESVKLDLTDDTFRQQAKAHSAVAPLRELRSSLAELRLSQLAVGSDGRNRTLLSPFRSRTGRNQPSNAQFIFGPSTWIRGLIQPAPGMGIAYVDWSQQAMLHGVLWTVFGWHLRVDADTNPRMLRNFPMQANGAEMLRLACCYATEQGIEVCAPVHDAILIWASLDQLDQQIAATRACMAKASRDVLDGEELRTDVNVVRYPDRYMDTRGAVMWQRVLELIDQKKTKRVA